MKTRKISWIKVAWKDFEDFPEPAKLEAMRTLTIAAEGSFSDNVKQLKGFESGIIEIVLRCRGDAFRVIFALKIAEDIWVIHAFQKKSKQGIKTPQHEIELIRERIKRLKELLK